MELQYEVIENALAPQRLIRSLVASQIMTFLGRDSELNDPFAILFNLFIRLKSADSIVEKIKRKNLAIHTPEDIQQKMKDILGLRIITAHRDDLVRVATFVETHFQVVNCVDSLDTPNEYGYRSREYELGIVHNGELFYFELQLRTRLQHLWSQASFHLFHKTDAETPRPYLNQLKALSEHLNEADRLLRDLQREGISDNALEPPSLSIPLLSKVNLVVIAPHEIFVTHRVVEQTGDARGDHDQIVLRKLELYKTYPNCAVVECSCLSFQTFTINEPHVIIPLSRLDQVVW